MYDFLLCQPDCAFLHKTVNMVGFLCKNDENTYPKRRSLMLMYKVVPLTKSGPMQKRCFHVELSGIIIAKSCFYLIYSIIYVTYLLFLSSLIKLLRQKLQRCQGSRG